MKITKRKIAVDIDEVLFPLIVPLTGFYNQRFGTNFQFNDYHSYDLENTWGGSKERAVAIVHDFYKSSEFQRTLPIEGSQSTVSELTKNHDLVAITSRPSWIREETERWMRSHFRDHINEIVFNGQYRSASDSMDKSDFCLSRGISLIIEDHLGIAQKCADNGINALLLDRPWNQNGSLHPRVQRVFSWLEILQHLK